MILRNQQGQRRVSPALYKLLLTAHIIVSGAWLGIVLAKLTLGVTAATSADPGVARALYAATEVVNPIFPAAAIGTIATGLLLSLGTKWGLLQHYWVVTKLLLTVGVIATAVRLGDRAVQQAIAATAEPTTIDGTILGIALAATLLLVLSAAHALMLGAAMAISVYKPWGKTWFARRGTARPMLHQRQMLDQS